MGDARHLTVEQLGKIHLPGPQLTLGYFINTPPTVRTNCASYNGLFLALKQQTLQFKWKHDIN